MNSHEQFIVDYLEQLGGKYITLQLHPEIGSATISGENNRLLINEGRLGKFNGVSESFYDSIVDKYDSRYNRNQ